MILDDILKWPCGKHSHNLRALIKSVNFEYEFPCQFRLFVSESVERHDGLKFGVTFR